MSGFLEHSELDRPSLEAVRKSKQTLDSIPIPPPSDMESLRSYRSIPAKYPSDRGELVDALKKKFKGSNFFASDVKLHPLLRGNLRQASPGILVRKDLLAPLQGANKALAPYGYELFLTDGYRTAGCQAEIRKRVEMYWHDQGKSFLSEEGLREFCSTNADKTSSTASNEPDPNDSTTWFAHCTGASLNIILMHCSGAPAEMGSMLVDLSGSQVTNYYEVHPPRNLREEMARTHRRLLFWSLALNGWYNYPLLYAVYSYCSDSATQNGIQCARAWNFSDVTIPEFATIGPALE